MPGDEDEDAQDGDEEEDVQMQKGGEDEDPQGGDEEEDVQTQQGERSNEGLMPRQEEKDDLFGDLSNGEDYC